MGGQETKETLLIKGVPFSPLKLLNASRTLMDQKEFAEAGGLGDQLFAATPEETLWMDTGALTVLSEFLTKGRWLHFPGTAEAIYELQRLLDYWDMEDVQNSFEIELKKDIRFNSGLYWGAVRAANISNSDELFEITKDVLESYSPPEGRHVFGGGRPPPDWIPSKLEGLFPRSKLLNF